MIDASNGTIIINNSNQVKPGMSKDEFENCNLFSSVYDKDSFDEWDHYRLRNQIINNKVFNLTLTFNFGILHSVSLYNSDEKFGTSWNDWALEKEMDRKKFMTYGLWKC